MDDNISIDVWMYECTRRMFVYSMFVSAMDVDTMCGLAEFQAAEWMAKAMDFQFGPSTKLYHLYCNLSTTTCAQFLAIIWP